MNRHALFATFKELFHLQNQLLHRSPYFGALFYKLLGTDTLPFLVMTTDGELLRLSHKAVNVETCYFRLEAVEQARIYVSLLRAFDAEERETAKVGTIVRLEKTEAKLWISLSQLSAMQLVDAHYLLVDHFAESKW